MPPCLIDDGKFRGELFLTLAYAPPLNDQWSAEYVRTNIDVSFGEVSVNPQNGRISVSGWVPMQPAGPTASNYEHAQVEYGYKWSPIKSYRKAIPRGAKAPETWGLQATVTRRANEPPLASWQRAIIVVSVRALDPELPVYLEGRQLLNQSAWVHQNLATEVQIR